MQIFFSELARQELEDAAAYLEFEFEGLGTRFKTELKKATLRIARHPLAWPIERGDVRKALLNTFPYKILYSVESDQT